MSKMKEYSELIKTTGELSTAYRHTSDALHREFARLDRDQNAVNNQYNQQHEITCQIADNLLAILDHTDKTFSGQDASYVREQRASALKFAIDQLLNPL